MCSDGLTDLVSDNEIKEIILNSEYPEEACNNLVMTANNYGGNDNISVILFSVEEVWRYPFDFIDSHRIEAP